MSPKKKAKKKAKGRTRGQPAAKTKRKRGRPEKPAGERLGGQVALRLDQELLDRIDTHRRRLEATYVGVPFNRSSTIRRLVIERLNQIEEGEG